MGSIKFAQNLDCIPADNKQPANCLMMMFLYRTFQFKCNHFMSLCESTVSLTTVLLIFSYCFSILDWGGGGG